MAGGRRPAGPSGAQRPAPTPRHRLPVPARRLRLVACRSRTGGNDRRVLHPAPAHRRTGQQQLFRGIRHPRRLLGRRPGFRLRPRPLGASTTGVGGGSHQKRQKPASGGGGSNHAGARPPHRAGDGRGSGRHRGAKAVALAVIAGGSRRPPPASGCPSPPERYRRPGTGTEPARSLGA